MTRRQLSLLLTGRWATRTVGALVAVLGCVIAARWQLGRAESRHSLQNWSYVITWLLFAGFVVLVWGWYLRDEARYGREPALEVPQPRPDWLPPVPAPVTEDEDPELAAYNRYLQQLNSQAES